MIVHGDVVCVVSTPTIDVNLSIVHDTHLWNQYHLDRHTERGVGTSFDHFKVTKIILDQNP